MELKNFEVYENIIEAIEKNSIAEELEIETGDILLSINGEKIKDILDYKYLISDEYVLLEIQKKDGEIWEYEIEKDFDEDIGIIFTNPLIDKAKNCRNKCIFCFIDQLPPNMRETLYFKDDDSRLSFLQGNFITLTNMSDLEIERIIKYKLSPINVSVHTTNPDLRIKMLNNKNAGGIFETLKKFHKAGLEINCQIVLVPDVNDGDELKRTLFDLSTLYPSVKSVAVVPIGVTKYREGLQKVIQFDAQKAGSLIDSISIIQEKLFTKHGTRFVFLSDEFYALSKKRLPRYEEYENFPQLENGVGLMKLFQTQVLDMLADTERIEVSPKKIIVATGILAKDFMSHLVDEIKSKFVGLDLIVVPINNDFFGHTISVSGLVTGEDLINQLKALKKDGIIIPRSMLKADEDVFLDNLSLLDVSEALNTKVIVSNVSGRDFIKTIETEVNK